MQYQDFLLISFWHNTVQEYLYALAIAIVLTIVFKLFRTYLVKKFRVLASKTKTKLDDVIVAAFARIHPRVYDLMAIYSASQILVINPKLQKIFDVFLLAIILVQLILSSKIVIDYLLHVLIRNKDNDSDTDETIFMATRILVQIIVWATAILLFLSNLGLNVNSLIASLGIGGIAIALAVQNILGDIFSSLSIYLDRPFVVGDSITVGSITGTVEKIGLKTTRIRSVDGEEIVVSNKDLTTLQIRNLKKMKERRVAFVLDINYNTSLEKCKAVPEIIKKIIEEIDGIRLDRVHFREFANSSLIYEIVYIHESADYNQYMDARQKLNFRIKEEFEKAAISFAFPSQTLYFAS